MIRTICHEKIYSNIFKLIFKKIFLKIIIVNWSSYMINSFNNKRIINILLSVIFAILLECYIVLIENANLVLEFSKHDFLNLFSFKEFLVFLVIFLIVFYILLDETKRVKTLNFIYNYRLALAVMVIVFAVIFQIHGSSINQLNLFNVNHKTLLGVPRPIRADEYIVNTPFAFSQYFNNFSYFSEIVRGTFTDMFIIYGQPVLDIGTIFRPFLIGYLFLNQGQGLSFFWISRLVFLFLISFEFGMLLTNKNKTLSLAYSILITFSPLVQWWFAINGLVEQLIMGQLGVLLINWYMTIPDYKKRLLIGFGLMICVGTYLLVFYPSWQIPFAYVFVLLAFWIFLKNRSNFMYSKKDVIITLIYLIIFSVIMIHILTNSLETIKITLNTVYPGSEIFNGGGTLNTFINYIPTIFFPLDDTNLLLNTCEYSLFVDLFPVPLILSSIIIFYQKTKDKLLIGLLALYIILLIFYFIQLPDFIIQLTLRSKIRSHRLFPIITFISVLILIRSMSSLNEIKNKKIIFIFSLVLSIIIVYLSTFEFSGYYLTWMPIFAIIIYFIVFTSSFLASSKRNQKIFLISIITLSFLTGALVNPIDNGTDAIYKSPFLNEVEKIVESDPDALWITQGQEIDNYIIPVGAKTVNSVNTYPNLDRWEKLDVNNQYGDIYNRYAHILFDIQKINDTSFELLFQDRFTVHINVNDLEKLNITYIATNQNLEKFKNDNISFNEISEIKGYKIYKISYT